MPSAARLRCVATLGAVLIAAGAIAATSQPASPFLERLRAEADAIAPTAQTGAVREWLGASSRLTPITPRSIWFRTEPRSVLSQSQFEALPEPERGTYTERAITEDNYYATNYGTPLCYARALDYAAAALGLETFNGARILDYGYGQIGQLRMLAACGAEAVGVDPAPGLGARYSLPEDQGPYPPMSGGDGPRGSVAIVTGLWPGTPDVASAVGGGYDAIIARNVLKHGYVHPIVESPPGSRIDLSCSDEEFLRATFQALKPGGVWVVYNLGGPRLRNGAYDPSADINCPWTRADLEAAGFEVVHFDLDDSAPTRVHALAFGWATPEDPVDAQWFSLVTVLRRPGQ